MYKKRDAVIGWHSFEKETDIRLTRLIHSFKKRKEHPLLGERDALLQREWEKCSRSNKRGVCLVCDLFHVYNLSWNNSICNSSQSLSHLCHK